MCKDPLVKKMTELGYSSVKLPREDIAPLHVFIKPNAKLEKLGSVTKLVKGSGEPVPEVVRDSITSEIGAEKTKNIDIKVGVTYLEALLSAAGIAKLGAEAQFSRVDSFVFYYKDVRKDYIDPLDIDKYLRSVTPDLDSSFYPDLDKQGEGYIVTEILKSHSFGVSAYDKNGYALAVDIPALEGLLMVKPNIKVSTEGKEVITYTGEKSLCFAVKLFNLWIGITDPGSAKFYFSVPKATPSATVKALEFAPPERFSPVIFKEDDLIEIK